MNCTIIIIVIVIIIILTHYLTGGCHASLYYSATCTMLFFGATQFDANIKPRIAIGS